ncbi:TPA: hypothetical protein ACGIK9_003401 [Acinetobacter baumannii]|uniref:hypothetical protein n=1 Tax=Acinetobacter baumannii TaxID=470 RepID=UPI00338E8F7A
MADEAMEKCYCCGKKLNMKTCVSGEVFQHSSEKGFLYAVFEDQETPDFLNTDDSLGGFNFGKTCTKNIKKNDGYFDENWMG